MDQRGESARLILFGPAMGTKDELEAARLEPELVKLRLAAWSDYIGFATSKSIAVSSIVCGGLDIFSPSLNHHISQPQYLLGGGLALLTGKSMVNLFSKILKGLA